MAFKVEWEGDRCHVNYFGSISDSDVMQARNKMIGDSRFDDLNIIISNFLNIESVTFCDAQVERNVSVHSKVNSAASRTNPKIKQAIVAVDETVVAFFNLYLLNSGTDNLPWQIKIFSTLSAAEDWVVKN